MNLGKLQDKKSIHKNHLHFYVVTMKNQKEKLRLTQRNFVLAQKQKYRAMEQHRKPRNEPRNRGNLFLTKEARIYNGAKTTSSISGAGKTGQLHGKE